MADRSVSIELRVPVGSAIKNVKALGGDVRSLSAQMTETGASAGRMRQRLEAATRALPKIKIDADSTAAEVKFAELRRELESLADKRVGIDIDATAAQAKISEIEQELRKLAASEPDVHVRADITAAIEQLRLVDAQADRLDGKNANVHVNADVGGAMTAVAAFGAALAALPSAVTIGVGVAGMGAAFGAAAIGAAAFGAAAVPAMGRINEALQAQESAAKGAGAATGGAGQSAAQAASQALQLEQAERRVADAQKGVKQAQEDLTRAREDGRRALEDMNFSLERSVLSEKDAALAVKEARERLNEVNADSKASDLDRERASLSLEQALQREEEQEVKTTRAKKDTATANREGVKGTDEYKGAQDQLRQAQDQARQASDQLKTAHLQQQAAMSGGGGAASKLQDAFAGLSKEEKTLARDLKAFKDEYVAWQQSVAPDVLPAIGQGLDVMRAGLAAATPLARSSGQAFTTLGKEAETALTGEFWTRFLFNVNTAAPTAIIGLGRSFGNVTTGVAGVIDAFLPFVPTVVGGAEDATRAWSEWGQKLKDSPEFHEFIAFVKENAPVAWSLIKDVATSLGNVAEGVAPLGVAAFSGLGLLAKITAGMDPQHIQLIALAIVAIKLAQAGLGVARFFTEIPDRLGTMRDGFDKAKTSAGKFKDAVSGLGEKLGPESLIGGAAAAGGLLILEQRFADAATAAGRYVDTVTTGAGADLDAQIAAVTKALKAQEDAQGPNIASWIYFTGAGKEAGDRMDALTGELDDLNHQKEIAAIRAKVAGTQIAGMGDAASTANTGVSNLNTSMDTFAGRTDALQATQNMKTAFLEAKDAIDGANGKLAINAGMTDKQRDAVITAREKFGGYIESVRLAADGASTLTGKTTDGTKAVLEQLPKLGELAGKNSEAREQILKLAEAYGISRDDANKAMGSAKGLRDMLAQLKSKQIKIDADTSAARAALKSLLDTYIKPYNIPIGIRKPEAAGGVNRYAAGMIDYWAAAGLQTRPQPPGVVSRPTVLYGEGSSGKGATEAFIPYQSQFRDRAVDLLSQVAGDFGFGLYGKEADQQVQQVAVTVSNAATQLGANLGTVDTTLTSTFGDTGSLTTAIGGVSTAGDAMAVGWTAGAYEIGDSAERMGTVLGDAVTVMSTETSGAVYELTKSVRDLGTAVAAAASRTTASVSGGGGTGYQLTKGTIALKPDPLVGNSVAGSYGTGGASYVTTAPMYSTSAPVNSSQVSAPVQAPSSSSTADSTPEAGSSGSWGREGMGNNSGPAVVINGPTINNEVDANLWATSIAMKVRARGR